MALMPEGTAPREDVYNTRFNIAQDGKPSVDESRLREMALSMASSRVGSGEFVTTRAQKYLDFLKGDAEPKQPPFADGEGVFE